MKLVFAARGLPVAPGPRGRCATSGTATRDADRSACAGAFGYPVFVKPANLGIERRHLEGADAQRSSRAAIELAFEFDRKVVVEAAVPERARDRVRACSATTSPRRRCPARSSRRASSTTTRRSTSTTARRPSSRRRSTPSSRTRGPAAGDRGVPGGRRRRHGARRLPAVAATGQLVRQRGQHHPRLHHDQHVREAVGGQRRRLSARCSIA